MQITLRKDDDTREIQGAVVPNERVFVGVVSAMVQTGPYDTSDTITLEYDPELHEYRVLHWDGQSDEAECVFSLLEERV